MADSSVIRTRLSLENRKDQYAAEKNRVFSRLFASPYISIKYCVITQLWPSLKGVNSVF